MAYTAPTTKIPNIKRIFVGSPAPNFSLADLPDFPYTDWNDKVSEYTETRTWFTGEALDQQVDFSGKKADLYPVKVNPISGACMKHAHALFGEFPDDAVGPLLKFRILADNSEAKESAKAAEEALARVWWENLGGSLMMENGITSQILGGCIFKASVDPGKDPKNPKIRIEKIDPAEFWCIPSDNNPWTLQKAWIIRKITADTALEHGVVTTADEVYYIETWTPDHYRIQINDQILGVLDEETQTTVLYDQPNPFGFVPMVYIPHQRDFGIWGTSVITNAAKGLVREINARLADIGDATNEETHGVVAIRNVRQSPTIITLQGGLPVINLGSGQSLGGKEVEPDMFSVSRNAVTDAMIDNVHELLAHFRREVSVPAVAYGEDEGSQRSSLTLVTRMWPLVSHVKMERSFWTTGLHVLNNMILKMMALKKIGGITQEHLQMRMKSKWFPILPRDREQLVTEAQIRMTSYLGSPKHMLEMLGDVEDVDEEWEEIEEWVKFQADTQADAQAQAFQQRQSQQATSNKGSNSSASSANKSVRAREKS